MAFGGLSRVPREDTRIRRNVDRLRTPATLFDPNNSIKLDSQGRITLTIATDEPLSQDSNGLALEIDGDTISESANGIKISEVYQNIVISFGDITRLQSMTYTNHKAEESLAQAFYFGVMQ